MSDSCSVCSKPSTVNYDSKFYCQMCFMTVDISALQKPKPKKFDVTEAAIKQEVENTRYYMKRMQFYKDKWETLLQRYENLQEAHTKLEKQNINQFRNKGDL